MKTKISNSQISKNKISMAIIAQSKSFSFDKWQFEKAQTNKKNLFKTEIVKILAILLLAFLPNCGTNIIAHASTAKTCFARVEAQSGSFGIDFFGESDKSECLFQIPNHFYVLATGADGEFFKVTYKDSISGYVRKSDVTLVDGIPQNKYPEISFEPKNDGTLFNSPNKAAKGVSVTDKTTLEYFGQKSGESLQTDINGNPVTTWYYVRTSDFEFGYIHTTDVAQVPNATRASEDGDLLLPEKSPNFFSEEPASFSGLSLGTQILLIIAIGLPSLMILYFLVKPTKIMKSTKSKTKTNKKPRKRVSHGDYFEFDESEL